MKKLMLALLMITALVASAADKTKIPKNKWFQNGKGYKEALELQKQTDALMLVYFENNSSSDQKGLCSWWEKKGLSQPDVQRVVDDMIKVKFTFPLSKDDQALADKWYVKKCPNVMVIQPDGWRARVDLFDWTGNKPDLYDPQTLVQNILNASAAESKLKRKFPADESKAGEAQPEAK